MLKRILIIFILFLVVTGIFIAYKNTFAGGNYAWYDGIGLSALATVFYGVLISVLERQKK